MVFFFVQANKTSPLEKKKSRRNVMCAGDKKHALRFMVPYNVTGALQTSLNKHAIVQSEVKRAPNPS